MLVLLYKGYFIFFVLALNIVFHGWISDFNYWFIAWIGDEFLTDQRFLMSRLWKYQSSLLAFKNQFVFSGNWSNAYFMMEQLIFVMFYPHQLTLCCCISYAVTPHLQLNRPKAQGELLMLLRFLPFSWNIDDIKVSWTLDLVKWPILVSVHSFIFFNRSC